MTKESRKNRLSLPCLLFATACIALLVACPPVPPAPVAVTGVSLDKTSLSLSIGGTEQLTATVAPADAAEKGVSYSTSNAAVATVSSSGLVTAVSAGSATITATSADGGFTAACAVTVAAPAAPVTGVTLNRATATIDIGYTEQLTATVAPADAANKNVTWSTSDAAVATVSASGLVTVPATAADGQTATITATTAEGGFTAACVVTANFVAVAGLSVEPSSVQVGIGNSSQLAAVFTPAHATNKGITWESDTPAVATVSASGLVTVSASATAGQTATITATSAENASYQGTCTVTAVIPVASVSLNKDSTIIDKGYTEQLTATISPAGATNHTVSWSSSNEGIATVSSTGLVSAVAGGSATITVTTQDGGFTDTCAVTVHVPVSGLSLNKDSTTVNAGSTEQLTATVAPADASNKNVNWSTSNSAVATVSASGLVTGVANGTATITATSAENGAFTDSCAVTVVVPVTGVNLTPSSASVEIGATQQLTAGVLPAGATNANVTWSTSDAGRATVSATGLVTGVSDGDVTITVRTQDGNFTDTCLVTVLPPLYRSFNSINVTTNAVYAVPATRRAVGSHSIVYVENAQLANVSEAAAAAVCAEFDADIYGMMRSNFANESDVDGNGKVIFLLQDIIDGYDPAVGAYVAGFFNPVNQFEVGSEPDSNVADMLFMDVTPATVGSAGFYGTMAHEFQHLISFTNTFMVNGIEQTIWINEGLSSGAEYLYAGAQVASRINYFNNDPQGSIVYGNNFFIWNGILEQAFNDQLANYSTVYLFFQWLQLHASNGTGIYKDILTSTHRDYQAVTAAASSRIGASYADWETLLRTWMISNRINRSTGDYGYLGQITVASPFFSNSGAYQWEYFSPGEGIISRTSGGTYTPPAGSGADIRYAGFSSTGTVDATGPSYTGYYALVFNSSTSQDYLAQQTGFIANTESALALQQVIKPLMSSTALKGPYAIDVSFGSDGKPRAGSHTMPGKKREGFTKPLIMKPVR